MKEERIDLTAKIAGESLEKDKLFHTSSYAQIQSESGIGASGQRMDIAKRAAIEAQRKFVQEYKRAKLMQNASQVEQARRGGVDTRGDDATPEIGAKAYGATPGGRGETGAKVEYAQTKQAFMQEKIVRPSDKYRKNPG